jgi:exopolysaccharide biosynthesis polyprenyl glycosylphosphotransferase
MFARPFTASRANLAADCLLVVLASIAAGPSWRVSPLLALVALGVWLAMGRVLRHYDAWRAQQGLGGDLALASVLVIATSTAVAIAGAFMPVALDRFLLVLWPAVLWVRLMIPGMRKLVPEEIDETLVIGTGSLARHTGDAIGESGRVVCGYLALPGDPRHPSLPGPVLGGAHDLERVLRERHISEVYVAGDHARHEAAMQQAVRTCERFGVRFALPASRFRLDRARPAHPEAVKDGYVHYLAFEHRRIEKALKRCLDIAASSAALALLMPLFAVVALAIKLTSRGPVLFKQERAGLWGRPFHMLKFRTMMPNADALKASLLGKNEQTGPVFKMKNDPRVTTIGRWLRKYSIDELPQLVNVLRGEMSIVGPRPPIPSEVARYEGWQRRRLSVRPGLTCVWQVSGRNLISFEGWMYLDMQYIDNWSLKQDLVLILKTVPVVVTGRGAS